MLKSVLLLSVVSYIAVNGSVRRLNWDEPTASPTPTTWSWARYPQPTPKPTDHPTKKPTWKPTWRPTWEPTKKPTWEPTKKPTWSPSKNPTWSPTKKPTWSPSRNPTESPTKNPTWSPSRNPTESPTKNPTWSPSRNPTESPTKNPTWSPSRNPTESPTKNPTWSPSRNPTESPTKNPTWSPSRNPTESPTKSPTRNPSESPTGSPTAHTPCPTVDKSTFVSYCGGDIDHSGDADAHCFIDEGHPDWGFSCGELGGVGDVIKTELISETFSSDSYSCGLDDKVSVGSCKITRDTSGKNECIIDVEIETFDDKHCVLKEVSIYHGKDKMPKNSHGYPDFSAELCQYSEKIPDSSMFGHRFENADKSKYVIVEAYVECQSSHYGEKPHTWSTETTKKPETTKYEEEETTTTLPAVVWSSYRGGKPEY